VPLMRPFCAIASAGIAATNATTLANRPINDECIRSFS
jgi:hypothetical protein